jgi:hypothetical protein
MVLLAKVVTPIVTLARSLLDRCSIGLVAGPAIAGLTLAQVAFALDLHPRGAQTPLGAFVLFFVGADPMPARAIGHGDSVAVVAAHPIGMRVVSSTIGAGAFVTLNRRLATLRPEIDEARTLVRLASRFLVIVVLVTIVERG